MWLLWKIFNGATSLRIHIKKIHEDHIEFKCEYCGKWFIEAGTYEKHSKSSKRFQMWFLWKIIFSFSLNRVINNNEFLNKQFWQIGILKCNPCVPINSVSFGKYTCINAKTGCIFKYVPSFGSFSTVLGFWQFWYLYLPF